MGAHVKQEDFVPFTMSRPGEAGSGQIVSLSSSSSSGEFSCFSFGSDSDGGESGTEHDRRKKKKQRVEAVLPVGFLDPIRPEEVQARFDRGTVAVVKVAGERDGEEWREKAVTTVALVRGCRQFWKAGDYEECGSGGGGNDLSLADMDHVRVHPRFLHSNATSHKWALGAFAELLDNALDEVCNGATYVHVDVLENKKDKNKMVMIQDDGGGMTPDKMRQCMSLGYSAKSKMANTIGQYGNGFKTSTMRLGADVIVCSRCEGKYGGRATQSIGMLSYTFLQKSGKEDIVVPMIDYEKMGGSWHKRVKSSSVCWQMNLDTILQWSPYDSEEDLLQQFNFLGCQGTHVVIYNLWEDDQGSPELDFSSDPHDIQIRGVSRDEKKIALSKKYPSCRHFLAYRHSLRSYASILYRSIPPGFRIILRGKDVDHHDIVDDLIHKSTHVYKPAARADTPSKDSNMSAEVTLGFVHDAVHHIDIQGFNVYHKNRLIKPFWRIWNAAGSDGRGVVGVLEANFVEPAHDKQGFERTIALSRLEARLLHLQKNYWSTNCHLVGYAQRRHSKNAKEVSAGAKDKSAFKKDTNGNISNIASSVEQAGASLPESIGTSTPKPASKTGQNPSSVPASATVRTHQFERKTRVHHDFPLPCEKPQPECPSHLAAAGNVKVKTEEITDGNGPVTAPSVGNGSVTTPNLILRLKEENHDLRESLRDAQKDLQFEKDRCKSLQKQLDCTKQKLDKLDRDQEQFVGTFLEERRRRDEEEQHMKQKLKEASETIEGLMAKVKRLDAAVNDANASTHCHCRS